MSALSFDKFKQVTSLVIDKMEGGYYHPDMLKKNPEKFRGYEKSGETMFGIDRKTGGSINQTEAGKKFWQTIDNANARKNWAWLYTGGELKPILYEYASQMMFPQYNRLSNTYLSSKSQEIINSDNRLLFNFIYATWNGEGWFKKFATDFNKKVASGETDRDKLVDYAIALRTTEGLKSGSSPNSLIKQGGEKIASFINELKGKATEQIKSAKKSIQKNPFVVATLVTALVLSAWFLVKTIRNK